MHVTVPRHQQGLALSRLREAKDLSLSGKGEIGQLVSASRLEARFQFLNSLHNQVNQRLKRCFHSQAWVANNSTKIADEPTSHRP